jgi:hypothetical protein
MTAAFTVGFVSEDWEYAYWSCANGKPRIVNVRAITKKDGLRDGKVSTSKARQHKETETKKNTISFIINDLENKLRFIEESHQYKDYKPFFTDMWDAVILTGRHSLLSFEIFEDLQHTYLWMKYIMRGWMSIKVF